MNKRNFKIKGRRVVVLSATFLLVSLVLLFTACKKEDTKLGKSTYPIDLLLQSGGVDTFTLKTYTVANDSVYSTRPSSVAIGMMNDPVMGKIQAGLYTQLDLAYLNPYIAATDLITVDSFVLSMKFNGSYGAISKQKIEIYEVNQTMYYDTNYLITRDLNVKPDNWVTDPWVEFDNVSFKRVGQDSLSPQIRVNLQISKANEILEKIQDNPNGFTSNSSFREYLKGIYIRATEVQGGGVGMIGNFVPVSKESKLTIYYTRNGESHLLELVISSGTTYFSRYHHDTAGSDLQALLNNPSMGQTRFFAQAGRHLAAINMSTIKNLPKNAVIHTAYLYLPVEASPMSPFTPAASVSAIGGISKKPLANSSTGYESYMKGYMMDLKGYAQGVLTGVVEEETLLISPNGFVNSGNRVIFNGPNTANKFKPRLVINYTEF